MCRSTALPPPDSAARRKCSLSHWLWRLDATVPHAVSPPESKRLSTRDARWVSHLVGEGSPEVHTWHQLIKAQLLITTVVCKQGVMSLEVGWHLLDWTLSPCGQTVFPLVNLYIVLSHSLVVMPFLKKKNPEPWLLEVILPMQTSDFCPFSILFKHS